MNMKKFFIMAMLAAAATTAFAQDALVKEAKQLFAANDLDQAAAKLAPALTSAETKDKAEAWNLMNEIKYKIYQEQFNKVMLRQPFDTTRMVNALIDAFKAAEQCEKYDSQPNEKGKLKIRFRKANSQRYIADRQWIYNGGIFMYQNHNTKEAIKAWSTYIDSYKSPLFQEFVPMPADTLLPDAAYNSALLAYQDKDYDTAKKYADVAASYPDKKDDAINMKLFIQKETLQTKADSAAYLATLKELHKAQPEKEQYFNLLQEYYGRANDIEAMKAWALEETKLDASNKMAWALLGEAEMNAEHWDAAIDAFKKAVELDPTWVACVFNTGICYNSKAIALNDELMDKKTMGLTDANAEKVKNVLRDAKVYLEKARELDPNHEQTNWVYPLYRIYYALKDKAKMAEMEALDPSLKE